MFIASKYEEMYCPEIGDFAFMTDKAYTKEEIRKMEVTILKKLDFCISYPLPLHFLRRNSKAGNVSYWFSCSFIDICNICIYLL